MRKALPSSAPKAVLIDVGLTLVHPNGQVMLEELRRDMPLTAAAEDDLVAALQLAAEARHLPLPVGDGDTRVAATWGMLLDLPADVAQRTWRRAIARSDLYDGLDPDAAALLDGLRARGLRIAAVSNSDGTLDTELHRFGLHKWFDVIVDSTLVGAEKPDPRIYLAACASLGLRSRECWFVGDGIMNDVIGAQGADIALGVLYDRFDLYRHLRGIVRVSRLLDILDLVDRGGKPSGASVAPILTEEAGGSHAHA